ncbi:XamI family restriction endonuclease [Halorussus pelagicus]|uniref:XamI family restriction endonuclease n=1 Tax=Halorussus pelagicus TaxID=2505977 RepID=UPI000FFC991F|nr:XamI family restriction endonuclease [Halorussus pelagicus]
MTDPVEEVRWTDAELDKHRQIAENNFIEQRMEQGVEDYLEVYHQKESAVRKFFERTDDLRNLSGDLFVRNPDFTTPARHVTAPPISQDDLDTIVGENISKRKTIPRDAADEGVWVIEQLIDPERFPWIEDERPPTDEEREIAIKATAGIWAVKRTQTNRRNDPAQEQEEHILETLKSAGLREKSITRIQSREELDQLPAGCVAHQVYVRSSEADITVRLQDGRLLAIEGKVSNSSLNSIKRLIHEVGDKASNWREEFGDNVVPAAVLSGVYDRKHLKEAQNDRDILIFWEHNLDSLVNFVEQTT